jgi:hypothetical protein
MLPKENKAIKQEENIDYNQFDFLINNIFLFLTNSLTKLLN